MSKVNIIRLGVGFKTPFTVVDQYSKELEHYCSVKKITANNKLKIY